MRNYFLILMVVLLALTGCQNAAVKTVDSSEESVSIESSTQNFYVRTPSSEEVIPSSTILEGISLPEELRGFCRQHFEWIKQEDKLFVEKKEINQEEYIAVELVDPTQSLEHLTAILDSEGEIERYIFEGDSLEALYTFIDYQEGEKTSTTDFTGLVEENTACEKDYVGEGHTYEMTYDLFRSGNNTGYIVTITPNG